MEVLVQVSNLKKELIKNFKIITNNSVLFLIYLNTFDNFKKNYNNYKNLFYKCKKLYGKQLNSIFIFIFHKISTIELEDNFSIIMTHKNPENFLKNIIENVKNLEGLRLIAEQLKINQIIDKRKQTAISKLPYKLIQDRKINYYIYNLELKEYSAKLRQLEKLLLSNEKTYIFYFKKNINQIEYIEYSLNYVVIFYPEHKKENFLNFLKTI